ncbi:MAG: hypothetical protein SYC29_11715 [Planctomycetota bacterium]|nr:hypothetical protein [Planctomycetota bacterium]
MVGRVRTANPDLYVRRCVVCGYDGALLQNGHAERCARCGCDLHLRPARSYAEMEGLIGEPITLDSPRRSAYREQRLIQRWLVFLFFVALGLLLMAYLVAAAIP